MQLNDSLEKFENLGIAVAAISYDAPDANQRFIDSKSISYQLLSDVGVQTVKRMGILNTNFAEDHPAFGVPNPGMLFVSSDGSIVLKRALEDYRQRPNLDSILEDIDSATSANEAG